MTGCKVRKFIPSKKGSRVVNFMLGAGAELAADAAYSRVMDGNAIPSTPPSPPSVMESISWEETDLKLQYRCKASDLPGNRDEVVPITIIYSCEDEVRLAERMKNIGRASGCEERWGSFRLKEVLWPQPHDEFSCSVEVTGESNSFIIRALKGQIPADPPVL